MNPPAIPIQTIYKHSINIYSNGISNASSPTILLSPLCPYIFLRYLFFPFFPCLSLFSSLYLSPSLYLPSASPTSISTPSLSPPPSLSPFSLPPHSELLALSSHSFLKTMIWFVRGFYASDA